jgi:alpha-tubulin suppressor-like RCC1 family protein
LINKKIVAISCGETHTQCLTDSGHLYSFGANGCGQLGQFINDLEKRRRGSFEEVTFPRITNSLDQ